MIGFVNPEGHTTNTQTQPMALVNSERVNIVLLYVHVLLDGGVRITKDERNASFGRHVSGTHAENGCPSVNQFDITKATIHET